MQQLGAPVHPTTDRRKAFEDGLAFLGLLCREWRVIAVFLAITVTFGLIYVARLKPSYEAKSRLLLLNEGGRPISMGTAGGDPFGAMQVQASQDSLSTHVMIIRSPLIIRRALESLKTPELAEKLPFLSEARIIRGLTVKIPDETAKIIEIDYKADTALETVKVLEALVASYDQFLKDNYQKSTNKVLSLLEKAQVDLSKEVTSLEKEYLEVRKGEEVVTKDGLAFDPSRLEAWNRIANDAMIRAFELRSQLEAGKGLVAQGEGASTIARVLGRISGRPVEEKPPTTAALDGDVGEDSYEFVREQLLSYVAQRKLAERQLFHLNEATKEQLGSVDEKELARAFYELPDVAKLKADLALARAKVDVVRRTVRNSADPALVSAKNKVRTLSEEVAGRWQEYRPLLMKELSPKISEETTRQAQAELVVLRAKENTLREKLEELKPAYLQRLRDEHARLVKAHGPEHKKAKELAQRLDGIETDQPVDVGRAEQDRPTQLLSMIQRDLAAVEAMQSKIQEQANEDRINAKKSELAQLKETNLKNNLERQRSLFNSVVDQLKQAQLVSDFGNVSAQVLDPPLGMLNKPPTLFILLLSVVAGLGLGTFTIIMFDMMDSRVRTLPELRNLLNIPVLGVIPRQSQEEALAVGSVGLVSHSSPRCALTEAYKSVRTSLEFLKRQRDLQVILVTSPESGDGKSTTASNLAISLAHAGRKVLLIDADLRKPSQHLIYEASRDHGLVQVLNDALPLRLAVQSTKIDNLDLLVAGPQAHNPAELLASPRLSQLMTELRTIYDIVIIDSSPLLAVTDPSVVAASVDGIVLVVRVSSTRRQDADRSMELLRTLGTRVLGMVINGVGREHGGYGYGYGYGHGYGYGYGYGYGGIYGSTDRPREVARPALDAKPSLANGKVEQKTMSS